jgi:DeoR/GlpR family transcriptional regulator of sugar metabolism
VVADSSKIGLVAFARICEVGAAGELITDRAADSGVLEGLAEAGVRVTTV